MTTDYERARSAILYIAEHADEQPSLDEVAAHVGLSRYHFQRFFTRWAGVSPKRFLQHVTASRAKALLRTSEPVLDAAFAVGLSGSGRLHDLLVATDAVTPGEFKRHGRGVTIRYGFHETPFGLALLGVTDRGICALRFTEPSDRERAVDELTADWPNATILLDESSTAPLARRVFGGTDDTAPLPMLLRGTNFQVKVWEGLLNVPEGYLISYGDLARRLLMPSSTRAVASAVGANPIGYLIPCHRVLRSTGELGGYRWGVDRKLVMLEREHARAAER